MLIQKLFWAVETVARKLVKSVARAAPRRPSCQPVRFVQLLFNFDPQPQPIDVTLPESAWDLLLWADDQRRFRFMSMFTDLEDQWSRATLQAGLMKLRALGFIKKLTRRGHYRITGPALRFLNQPAASLDQFREVSHG